MARRVYTQEFKEQAVKLSHNNGKSVAETATGPVPLEVSNIPGDVCRSVSNQCFLWKSQPVSCRASVNKTVVRLR
jgi:hypothetical protein